MNTAFKIFFCGLLISFVGSLPPGTMTIAATFTGAKQGFAAGMVYSFGSIIAELLVILLLLYTIKWAGKWNSIIFLLQVLATIFLIAVTVGCFYLASNADKISVTDIHYSLHPFSSGFLISILNPVHIPFWIGWSAVLIRKNLLQPGIVAYSIYLTGIAVGSLLGFTIYVYGGMYMLDNFMKNQQAIILITGIVLLVITLLHIKKLVLVNSALVKTC
jgi:threonine/homoserine/homoserine lactone efflux protein